MPRLNRGKTNRVSIKLSAAAKTRITAASENLGVSQASMIMYALSEQFEGGITKNQLLGIENKITLENVHFAIVMPEHILNKVNQLMEEYEMKRNSFIGYLVSDYFENMPEDNRAFQARSKEEPRQLVIDIHKQLQKRLYDYAEAKYMNVSFLIAEAIRNGRYKGIPDLPGGDREQISFSIPNHLYKECLEKADSLGVPLHFFIESCVYNAFEGGNKIFKE